MSNVNDIGPINSPEIMVDTLPPDFVNIPNQVHPLASMIADLNADHWNNMNEPLIDADYAVDNDDENDTNSLANKLFRNVIEPEVEVVDKPETKVTDIVPYQEPDLIVEDEMELGFVDSLPDEEIKIINPNPKTEPEAILEPEVILEGEFTEIDEGDDDILSPSPLPAQAGQPSPEGEGWQVNFAADKNADTSNINVKINHINDVIGDMVVDEISPSPQPSRVEVKNISKSQYETVRNEFVDPPIEVEPIIKILEENDKLDEAAGVRIKYGKIRDAGGSVSKPLELKPEKGKYDKNNTNTEPEQVDEVEEESILLDMLQYLMDLIGSPDFDPSTLTPAQMDTIVKADPKILKKVMPEEFLEEDEEEIPFTDLLDELNTNILTGNIYTQSESPEIQKQINTFRFFINAMHKGIRKEYSETGDLQNAIFNHYNKTIEILGQNENLIPDESAYALVFNGQILPIIKGQTKLITYENEKGEMTFLQGIPGVPLTTVSNFPGIPNLPDGNRLAILDFNNIGWDDLDVITVHLKKNINNLEINKPIEVKVKIGEREVVVVLRVIQDPEEGQILLREFKHDEIVAGLEG